LFLVDLGLLEIPVLYLSRYIIQHKQYYYDYLNRIATEGDWESWILFMLDAIRETAQWTTQKIRSIRQLMEITTEYVKETRPKVYDRDLLDLIFVQPYWRFPPGFCATRQRILACATLMLSTAYT
jgi:Fic family protein